MKNAAENASITPDTDSQANMFAPTITAKIAPSSPSIPIPAMNGKGGEKSILRASDDGGKNDKHGNDTKSCRLVGR